MPRGKQSGINYGQKKQQGQSDIEQLIDIQRYLITRYKLKVKIEWYVIFDNETETIKMITEHVTKEDLGVIQEGKYKQTSFAKNPDLMWIDKYGMWIIEVDGAVHDRKVKKTNERNELYLRNHIKLIVINIAEMNELNINIYNYIDKQIESKL